jgi:predicted nucleic-acid-binding Zn-ribbon protein
MSEQQPRCPKCGSEKRTNGQLELGSLIPSKPIYFRAASRSLFSWERVRNVTAVACAACGYVELVLKDVSNPAE